MDSKNNRTLIYFFLIFSSIIILRNAWVGDDAYIAFRTVYNFVNGYGLTFNINERVQSFTNPLWVLVMSLFYFFTGEAYFTSIFLSLFFTLLSLYVISSKLSKENYLAVIMVFAIALTSKAFIDYSTSGLENALSYFFIVLFSYIYLLKPTSYKKIFFLSIVASLATVNRLDNILLYCFPILFEFIKSFSLKTLGRIVVGLTPLILWELFAIIYYGFPFPNTYYSKLNTGIPSYEYVVQGIRYLINSLSLDPITLLTILVVFFISIEYTCRTKKYNIAPLALSIILYLIYTVKVGGDFMSGRFLTYPFVISLTLIPQFDMPKVSHYSIIACCIALSFVSAYSPIKSDAKYRDSDKWIPEKITANEGIADERGWWYPISGLLTIARNNVILDYEKALDNLPKQKGITKFKYADVGLGYSSYESGPNTYVFHNMGLSDALIARLPMEGMNDQKWRIGHIYHKIPDGYTESLSSDTNKIKNKYLSQYSDKLNIIIRGNLFSWQRIKTIYEMNTGKYNFLIDSSATGRYELKQLAAFENTILKDSNSYEGMARCVDSTTPLTNNNISFGPYTFLKKGKYAVNFSLRINNNKDNSEVVCIDVYNRGIVLAEKTLKAKDFNEPMKYQKFAIQLNFSDNLTSAEFRIFYKGHHLICNDYIEVVPIK